MEYFSIGYDIGQPMPIAIEGVNRPIPITKIIPNNTIYHHLLAAHTSPQMSPDNRAPKRTETRTWTFMKKDIMDMMIDLHKKEEIRHKNMGATSICLIPKKEGAESIRDFRPISLTTSSYKVLSSILANRLKQIMPEIISQEQYAFTHGRQILDSTMFIHEAIDYFSRSKKPRIALKIDLEKAFDRVEWNYLDRMMEVMEFPSKWRSWIRSCVSSARFTINVNGGQFGYFKSTRGLRQGDPLSPLLFNLVGECLTGIIKDARRTGWLNEILPEELLPVAQFADDTILLCEGTHEQVMRLKGLLGVFEATTGQKISWGKSAIYGVNMNREDLEERAQSLHCRVGDLPAKYLGLPMFMSRTTTMLWDDVIERLQQRLSGWKGRLISKGGRLTLLKACLQGIPIYALSSMYCPKKVANKIEQLMRNFRWRGNSEGFKHHLVNWKDVCKCKEEGGLGIRRVSDFNRALLLKWCWRLNNERTIPWAQLVLTKMGRTSSTWIMEAQNTSKLSATWRRIQNLFPLFRRGIRFAPGKGDTIDF